MPAMFIAVKTALFTAMAMVAFAANSVLCRLALGGASIDPISFTSVRLLSGAVTLALLIAINIDRNNKSRGSWPAALALFVYAIAFSLAYLSLDTGTGALILFGAVQITMITISLFSGGRLSKGEWLGVFIAFAGFVYLVLPGVSAPSPIGFALMSAAGIAWGIYTLSGSGSVSPLSDTAWNFLRTLPLVVLLAVGLLWWTPQLSREGIVLAILSGAIASGMGYAIWYAALAGLGATQAAVVQLSVPVIAALGGVLLAAEQLSLRLLFSAGLILGGILIVMIWRGREPTS